jgi:uncharacterized membrane protein
MAARLLDLLQQLAFIVWLGGLVYVCFVLPPMPHQEALPPVFVRMMGLMRFRLYNAAALAVLVVTAGILPFMGVHALPLPWQMLRAALLGVCVFSSVQLEGFLRSALAQSQLQPMPPLCDEDPSRVDKVLRQINKVTRALLFCGLAIVLISALEG